MLAHLLERLGSGKAGMLATPELWEGWGRMRNGMVHATRGLRRDTRWHASGVWGEGPVLPFRESGCKPTRRAFSGELWLTAKHTMWPHVC